MSMRKYLFAVIIICLPVFLFSCRMNVLKGEGSKATTTPAVVSFNAVVAELSLKVVVNVQEGGAFVVQQTQDLQHIFAQLQEQEF